MQEELTAEAEHEVDDATGPTPSSLRIALLYHRHAHPDQEVLHLLEHELAKHGHTVFIDRHDKVGVEWAREIEREIRTSDAVIPLVSEASVHSEMFGFEVEHAHDTARESGGLPRILPVRVKYTGPLHAPLTTILDPGKFQLWEGEHDNEGLVAELLYALGRIARTRPVGRSLPAKGERLTPKLASIAARQEKAEAAARPATLPRALESVGGAVPLDSEYYLERACDEEMRAALDRHDSIILVKGARQMGKTSLLARALSHARSTGSRAAFTDLQKLNSRHLESADNLYHTLAESLADQLDLDVLPSETWDEKRGANLNFERYLRREVLKKADTPLVWALDEVDRLFSYPFASEVFGLFRSWHNERALDPSGPWANLTLVISYATEAHLFITDLNQSPFNVGTPLALQDFTPMQVSEMNRRYRNVLGDHDSANRFVRLVGGHPFLVRRGLHEILTQGIGLPEFESEAGQDEGIFGDHLRRLLVLLAKNPGLEEIVRGILRGEPCPDQESFYRLRSAGMVHGHSPADARPRCRLYATYLKRHLL